MSISIHVTGAKHETAAELERVPAGAMLPVSACLGAPPRLRIIAAQQVREIGSKLARRAIRRALIVYQKRKRDAGLFAEQACMVGVAQAHRRQVRALVFERLLVLAQLRDVLAAEDSSVVPQETSTAGWLSQRQPSRTARLSASGRTMPASAWLKERAMD